VRRVALDFSERLLREAGNEPEECIERGYQLALARAPADAERTAAVAFVKAQIQERNKRASQAPIEQVRRDSLADLCQMLFSLNEFVYVD
jgi:hypothetical protein